MHARVETPNRLAPEQVTAMLALVEQATEADGVRPLDEQSTLSLRYGDDPGARAVLIYADDGLAGFAYLRAADEAAEPGGELVVHPAFRQKGLGRRLLDAVLAETGGRLRLWAHGDHPGAARLAAAGGLVRVRSLWRMRRALHTPPLPEVTLPVGVRLRAFEPGHDEQAWLALNAQAFATHPEQGAWTIDDLERREQEPWFDHAGFLLAVRQDTLVGFHWTKVHEDGERIGEVYVVGVAPGERGAGLGRALTVAGLVHLRALGLDQVMLYVDGDNTPAIRLYESLGFTRWDVDVMYRR